MTHNSTTPSPEVIDDEKYSTFRSRQAHQKSRQGCIRCKRQRKKCDEGKPKCLRCTTLNHVCQYVELKATQTKRPRSTGPSEHEEELKILEDISFGVLHPVASNHNLPGSITLDASHGDFEDPSFSSLDATELALLSHYIDHTSHVIPLDEHDYYVLHTGIPNLAFTSRPLMASLLALAAACKCNDLICNHEDITQNIKEIHNLLLFADEHHRSSLKSIQTTISNTNRHDHVLANAVLMVLYANANQSVRVSLARKTQCELSHLMDELRPQGSQWVTMVRAAHIAFVGLLDNSPNLYPAILSTPEPDQEKRFIPQDGPSPETRNLFVPIVAATYPLALCKLRSRVKNLLNSNPQSSISCPAQMCLDAMDALEAIVQELCLAGCYTVPTADTNIDHSMPNLSEVPDWLSSYVSRVTSVSTPTAIRRIIMSFLNRVPLAYIHCVSSTLERVASVVRYRQTCTYVCNRSEEYTPDICEKIAADIFAHWLVFSMFLDGVWWIRDIGIWELGRLVIFMQHEDWLDPSIGHEEWWPDNMLLIKKSITASIP